MLQLILNGNIVTKSMGSLTTTLMRCMSVERNPRIFDQRKLLTDRLHVAICGRISETPVKLENGSIVIPIITINDHDGLETKHRILATSQNLKNLFADGLNEGQRVHADGYIHYSEFRSLEGHTMHSARIMANMIFLCEENDISSDINEVKLFGHVQSPAHNTANATFLDVATQYFDRKEEIIKKRVHNVLIEDNEKLRQKANAVEAGTGVFIHGFLRTEFRHNQDQKLRAIYYIIPRNLNVKSYTYGKLDELGT